MRGWRRRESRERGGRKRGKEGEGKKFRPCPSEAKRQGGSLVGGPESVGVPTATFGARPPLDEHLSRWFETTGRWGSNAKFQFPMAFLQSCPVKASRSARGCLSLFAAVCGLFLACSRLVCPACANTLLTGLDRGRYHRCRWCDRDPSRPGFSRKPLKGGQLREPGSVKLPMQDDPSICSTADNAAAGKVVGRFLGQKTVGKSGLLSEHVSELELNTIFSKRLSLDFFH